MPLIEKTLKKLGAYDAKEIETRRYRWWMEQGYFKPAQGSSPYAIVMPPPNVTGVLHLGHALDMSMQDLLTRYQRMRGRRVLWLPGMDHAGIATQTRVEATIRKEEGVTRHDIGREVFVERVWAWKENYAEVIRNQIKRLGASCDWSRERFTMDKGLSAAVREVFVRLYEKGLIYRGNYIINWCPRCETALSDIEVIHEETQGSIYQIAYPFVDGTGHVVIATTRPETLFGDVAVAVHPDDERYRHLIGKSLRLPLTERIIPIIADEYVDPSFGTGAVKITPAHDPNDFEVGRRHALLQINVMNRDGTLNAHAGAFAGLDRRVARAAILDALRAENALKELPHQLSIGHCERCDTVVEPWLSLQWFVRMEPLAKPAMDVVASGALRFVPERFEKTYAHWLENIRDWCISRQLWWGHRIPAWHCSACGEITVSREDIKACGHCGSKAIDQDTDVLDTWFSSALWPFSTMGWPEQTEDMADFFPTQVLVTGFDIIYFWVARMVFTSLEFTGQSPFQDVLIHGLVRDAQGRKFSKSLGNGIDPMEVIERYSADALRFMLLTGAGPGQDMRFYEERVEAAQALVTKLWNAARFVLMNLDDTQTEEPDQAALKLADRYILSRLSVTVSEVTHKLDAYEFAEAGKAVYEFFWNDFCDWYIELSKVSLYAEGDAAEDARIVTKRTLRTVLDQALRLLHPFMPFVTEEIWQTMPHDGETIMRAPWPSAHFYKEDQDVEQRMQYVMEIIRTLRTMRQELNIPPGKAIPLLLRPASHREADVLEAKAYVERLCNTSSLTIDSGIVAPDQCATGVLQGAELYVPLLGVIDLDAECARLEKEHANLTFEVDRLVAKLANPSFVERAPEAVVSKEREKLAGYEKQRDQVNRELLRLRSVTE
ncbi:valine--tRNA ligase [Ferroacidibacillus organovorans]|uniref:Valine--tRNA ligase n=1 Tax=Ferroacidibacillus organovorans TaxID=1765683 RepID=A0A101XSZ2_9BACL|nr:valine--tRNA ligase [Ferroacidibacillus organovorans]